MKSPILNTSFFCFLCLIFSLSVCVQGQTIVPQVLDFDKICAGVNNQYNATFTHVGFAGGTTFEVILSDSAGSFTNPTSTTTLSAVDITSSQKRITFAVPTNLIGSDTYRLRVKSSTGYISSSFSVLDTSTGGTKTSFSAYYKSYEGVYFINNKENIAGICTGGSVTLSIDNPTPSTPNSSPVNYPNLSYKWFKNGVAISGETSYSLNVNAAGTYYVIIDYGPCTDSNSRSNSVVVTQSSGGTTGSVTSSLGNPFCSGDGSTTLSAVTGNSYQWSKDNKDIIGAVNETYVTNQPGNYKVRVNFGGCISTFSIDLKTYSVESTITNTDSNSIINEGETILIQDGETISVLATTDAINPSYTWYKNNSIVTGNQTNTYVVTAEGNYSVKITQNAGCVIVDQLSFIASSTLTPIDSYGTVIPNMVILNGSSMNQNWIIPEAYCNNETEIQIIDTNGETVLQTKNYTNNWPESSFNFTGINPVYYYIIAKQNEKPKQGSITIVR